jgi:hypothetical protein
MIDASWTRGFIMHGGTDLCVQQCRPFLSRVTWTLADRSLKSYVCPLGESWHNLEQMTGLISQVRNTDLLAGPGS